jgi:NAD(P)H-nitrite reductase large subunit
MVSNEPYGTYNRPMLTKSMVAELDAEQIAVEPQSWYEENRIYQVLNTEVVSIDPEAQEVLLADDQKLKYTKLIYALGSECFIPPIQGADKTQVVAIRRMTDIEKIEAILPTVNNVVVIGGGVLGLEAAWEFKKARKNVTVLELAPQIMGRQLDETASEMLTAISESNGISIHTGVQITSIEGDTSVTGVKLADGTLLKAELVIVSAGVRANTAVAKAAGMQINRGVLVNAKMETSIPGIYACGDCAEYEGINYAIWPQALEQGKTAGANAAGEEWNYETVSAGLSFNGMNTALYAIGDNGKNANLNYRTVEFKDMGRKQYEKYYFLNNRLCGVILIGDTSKMAKVTEALEKKSTFRDLFA